MPSNSTYRPMVNSASGTPESDGGRGDEKARTDGGTGQDRTAVLCGRDESQSTHTLCGERLTLQMTMTEQKMRRRSNSKTTQHEQRHVPNGGGEEGTKGTNMCWVEKKKQLKQTQRRHDDTFLQGKRPTTLRRRRNQEITDVLPTAQVARARSRLALATKRCHGQTPSSAR